MIPGTTTKLSEATVTPAMLVSKVLRPKTDIVKVNGGGNIQTIIPAFGGHSGFLILAAFAGAVTLEQGGNIIMTTPTIVLPQDRAIFLVYMKTGAAWVTGPVPA